MGVGVGEGDGMGEPRDLSSFTVGVVGDAVGVGPRPSEADVVGRGVGFDVAGPLTVFAVAAGFVRQRREKLSNEAIVLVVPASSSKRTSPSVSPGKLPSSV